MKGTIARLPSVRALLAFDSLARLGSISQAALDLHVSAGAVSQQIRLLERHLGVPLVERSGRGVVLTSLGRSYHSQVSVAFDALLRAQDKIERIRGATDITISALPSVLATWLATSLVKFRERHSAAALHLIGSEAEPAIDDEKVDFRISYGHRVRPYQHFAELFVDSVVPVGAPLLANAAALQRPADLLKLPLIAIEWDGDFTPAPSWIDWFRSVGLTPGSVPVGLTFSLSSAAIAAAVAGHGIALAQLSMVEAELEAGRLVVPFRFPLPLPEPYFIAWSPAALKKVYGPLLLSWLVSARRGRIS